MPSVRKIISGAQTGVDRAALDVAIDRGIDHGGWCPRGRRAEDGVIAPCYALDEMSSLSYARRTEKNILESQGTLILVRHLPLSGGTLLTQKLAKRHRRALLVVTEGEERGAACERFAAWIEENGVRVLNVAGPRASQAPGIEDFVWDFLTRVLFP